MPLQDVRVRVEAMMAALPACLNSFLNIVAVIVIFHLALKCLSERFYRKIFLRSGSARAGQDPCRYCSCYDRSLDQRGTSLVTTFHETTLMVAPRYQRGSFWFSFGLISPSLGLKTPVPSFFTEVTLTVYAWLRTTPNDPSYQVARLCF